MTDERVRTLVRKANPVPDHRLLQKDDAPRYSVFDEGRTATKGAPRQAIESGTGRRRRGALIGVAAAVAVVMVGVTLSGLTGNPPAVGGSTSTSVSSTLPDTTTSTTTGSTLALPTFPRGRTDLVQGGDTWAVVLAASEDGTGTALEEAESAARAAGYSPGVTDCDAGAAAALGLAEDSYYITVSVYLESEADAEAALTAFEARGIEGAVGLIQTFCID